MHLQRRKGDDSAAAVPCVLVCVHMVLCTCLRVLAVAVGLPVIAMCLNDAWVWQVLTMSPCTF
jgi:hypothetical protein